MKVYKFIPALSDVNLVTGTFDAIHKGHLKLIKKLMELEGKKVILSFYPPPFVFFGKEREVTFIQEEKEIIFKNFNLDALIFIPFSKEISDLSPEDFLKIITTKVSLRSIIVGKRFRFGKNRTGDINTLEEFGRKRGFKVFGIPEELKDGIKISSTMIRKLIRLGRIEEANKFLINPYFVLGDMKEGVVKISGIKLLPPDGDYEGSINNKEIKITIKNRKLVLSPPSYEKKVIIKFLR